MSHETSGGFEQPFALMGIGIPGSGKSPFLREHADTLGGLYLSAGNEDSEAWEELRDCASDALYEGQSVIIDAIHLDPEQRSKDVRLYRTVGAKSVIGLLFTIDFASAWERVQSTERSVSYPDMRRMHNALLKHPPTLDEGFDQVMSIDTSLPIGRSA